MKKNWHDKAWEEYLAWQNEDKKTLKKINRLCRTLIVTATVAQEARSSCQVIYPDFGV